MFKTRKKDSIRRRPIISKTAEESDDDDGNLSDASVGTVPVPPPASEAQAPPKKMRKKAKAKVEKGPKPVLSFGHEDEEESGVVAEAGRKKDEGVFRVKKSKASKAMAKAAKDKTELPAAPQNGSTRGSWHTATAGMYTAEGLAELRSSQAFTPKPSGGGRERRTRGGAGRAGGERVFAGEEAEMVHAAGQQGDLKEEGLDEEHLSRLKGRRAALLAAREARERGDDSEDFIALDGKVRVPGAGKGMSEHGSVGGKDGSRLGGDGDSGQVDDEEQQRWEDEQIRRGATRSAAQPRPPKPSPSTPWGTGTFGGTALAVNGGGSSKIWGATGERPRFLGVDEMQKALREAGNQLRETHERNERQLQVLVSELATQSMEEGKLLSQQKEAAERFGFFQRTRNALSDLFGMLREKESMLSELEAAKRLLHARRLERILAVRTEDQEDEVLDARDAGVAIASLGPYKRSSGGPLSKGPPLGAAGGGGMDRFRRRSPGSEGDDRARRRVERQGRRRRFGTGRATGAMPGGGEAWVGSRSFPWGEKEREEVWRALGSGGEESEGEEARADERSGKLVEAAEMVMDDVDDDVKSLSAVKALFEDWKRGHGEQYAQAYCTLTLPDLLAPFVRLELIHWDPLNGKVDGVDSTTSKNGAGSAPVKPDVKPPEVQAGGGGGDETDEGEDDLEGVFERFEWYRRLFDFSGDIPPPESAGYGAEEDPDQNLVPQLVEKVALPLVAERLSTAYDAMSRQQTVCLTAAVSELLVYDPGEASLKKLLGSALEALQTAVENLCIPVIGASSTPGGRAASMALVRLQACRCLKLLRNCLAWRDLLSPQSLAPLALGDLVAKRLVPALRGLTGCGGSAGGSKAGVGAVEALALCERAVELIPVDWMERPDTSAALANLRIAARLFGDGLAGAGGTEAVERVVRLQVALGDDGAAKELARKHGLKIA